MIAVPYWTVSFESERERETYGERRHESKIEKEREREPDAVTPTRFVPFRFVSPRFATLRYVCSAVYLFARDIGAE